MSYKLWVTSKKYKKTFMKNFKNLKIWRKGMEIVIDTYQLTEQLPHDQKYSLVQQVQKSAVSIPSNIAEGSGRDSYKDYKRFLNIAMGSAFEAETQLLLTQKLKFLDENKINSVVKLLNEEQKMIQGFINTLTARNSKPKEGY